MLNEDDLVGILDNITIPFGLRAIVGKMDKGHFIQLWKLEKCNRSDKEYESKGRKWYISKHAVENEIVFTVFKAVDTYIRHEMREQFEYKGKKIFDPHISLEALMNCCDQIETRA